MEEICNTYGLNITEKTIVIPGLKENYSFLYVSDNHIIIKTTETIETWNTNTDDRIKLFSNEIGLSSAEQFGGWIELANYIDVETVLLGGDTIDYLSEENISFVKEQLAGLSMPYFYTMGNHDSYNVFERRFEDDDPSLAEFFIDKDYDCQVIDYGEFCICAVNDYDTGAKAKVSPEALEKFKEVYDAGKPIILMCHVPFCTSNTESLKEDVRNIRGDDRLLGRDLDYECDETTLEFYDLVLREDSPVIAVLAGHIHFYHEDWLNDHIIQIVSDTSSNGSGLVIHITGK